MAPKLKPDGVIGSIQKGKQRVTLRLAGECTCGPCRATVADAEEDLRAMQALQRGQMALFLNRLKEGFSRAVPELILNFVLLFLGIETEPILNHFDLFLKHVQSAFGPF